MSSREARGILTICTSITYTGHLTLLRTLFQVPNFGAAPDSTLAVAAVEHAAAVVSTSDQIVPRHIGQATASSSNWRWSSRLQRWAAGGGRGEEEEEEEEGGGGEKEEEVAAQPAAAGDKQNLAPPGRWDRGQTESFATWQLEASRRDGCRQPQSGPPDQVVENCVNSRCFLL